MSSRSTFGADLSLLRPLQVLLDLGSVSRAAASDFGILSVVTPVVSRLEAEAPNGADGSVLTDTPVGAGALNVV